MSVTFRTFTTALGNDDTNEYSFPFKISDASELVIVQIDVSVEPPVVDFIERGDVGLNVQNVEFDSVLGGGTVTFAENLPAGKRIYIKVANDAPTQPSKFREQKDFNLRSFENALDFAVEQVIRLTDKSERSIKSRNHFNTQSSMSMVS